LELETVSGQYGGILALWLFEKVLGAFAAMNFSKKIRQKAKTRANGMLHPFIKHLGSNYSFSALGFSCYMLASAFHWGTSLIFILIIFSILDLSANKNTELTYDSGSLLLSISFLALYFLSITLSIDPLLSLTLSSIWPSAAFLYLTLCLFTSIDKDFQLLSFAFSLFSLIVSSIFLYGYSENSEVSADVLVSIIDHPLFLVPNDLVMLALISPFSFFIIKNTNTPALRYFSIASCICCVMTLIIFQSRTGLMSFFICMGVFLLLLNPKFLIKVFSASLALVISIDYVLDFQLFDKFLTFPSSRIPLWSAALDLFIENPIFGNGPHIFAGYYADYINSRTFADWIIVDTRNIPWPHNLFLELLSESGILTTLAFICLSGYTLTKLSIFSALDEFAQERSCLISIFLGFLFAAFFELTLVRIWVLLFVCLLFGLCHSLIKIKNDIS
jgi:O-antigen ligase